MHVAFELSGEHPTLPRAEATALLELAGATIHPERVSRVLEAKLVTDLEADPHDLPEGATEGATEWPEEGAIGGVVDQLAARLAMTHRIVQVHGEAAVDEGAITAVADEIPLGARTFAVRCSRLDPGLDPQLAVRIERSLGAALADGATVDLEAPEVTVRALLAERALVGCELARIERGAFDERHVELRPFFSPISLHPRLARALVNLSKAEAGSRVFDPFCGTGGLVLEAALVGAEPIGSDLDEAMVEGTRETLEHYGVQARLEQGDVAEVAGELGAVDAIVTDPPYGRASSTHAEDLQGLYDRFLSAASDVLAPGGRLVCMLPDPSQAERAPDELELVDQHAWYVHGSLTRHVLVFERG